MELAIGIAGGHGEAVELEFGDVLEGLAGEEFADAAVKIEEFAFVERVIEREHGGAMGQLDEAFAGGAADALGGGVWRDEFGVGGF